ncbi:MAG: hypothetical protein LBR30_02145, partial [Clostridioides sp.]|nr:hypothetical protein [Clostridioides sp.]
MTLQQIIALLIFAAVMLCIITEKINATVASLAGALLMIIFKIESFEKSITHIDFDTVALLFGMMVLVAVVKNSGLFEYIAIWAAKKTKGNPWKIMVYFAIITAVLSGI